MRLSIPSVRDLDPSDFPDDFAQPAPVQRVFKRRGWLLALLVVAALLPRLIMAWKVDILTEDGPIYIYAAMQLERGNWNAAFRDGNVGLNLYPVVLEGLHRLGLPWELSGRLWGTLMATLVVLPMFGWIRRQFNDRVAAVACLLYAAHPGLIERSPEMLRCPSFWLLLTAALYFLWRAVCEVRLSHFLLAGVFLTLGVHFRVEMWFLLVPWVLWTLGRSRSLVVHRQRLFLAAVAGLLVLPAFGLTLNLTWLKDHPRWEWCITQRANVVKQLLGLPQHAATSQTVALAQADATQAPPERPESVPANVDFAAAGSPPRSMRSVTGFVSPYVLKMVDALELMYLVPLLLGLWSGRRLLRHADQQVMLAFCATCLAAVGAFWYLVHDIQGRYFFPIVLVSSNYAALGICRLSELMSSVGGRRQPASNRRSEWAAVAVLSAAMVIGWTDAFTTRYNDRVARRDLGEWILTAFGPGQTILGSEPRGWTIAWYAQSRYYGPAPAEIGGPAFEHQMNAAPPTVILITARGDDVANSDWYRRLSEQGNLLSKYRPAPHECLPASARSTLVLVREAAWEQVARQAAKGVTR